MVGPNPLPGAESHAQPKWRSGLMTVAILGLAMILALALNLGRQAAAQRDISAAWERHTLDVLDTTAQLRLTGLDAMRGERGYLLVRDPTFLEPYHESLAAIDDGLARLERLVGDNLQQQERIAHVEGSLDYHIGTLADMIALSDSGRHEEAVARIARGEGRRAIASLMRELDKFDAVERSLLAQRKEARERSAKAAVLYEALLGFAGTILLGLGVFAAFALSRAIDNLKAMQAELARYAATDELTGLANRRETLSSLTRQMAAERRNWRPLSLAMLDIDHFKRVNDTFGHPAGDEVIRRVASLALDTMREQDLIGRLGGEEFVIVLPDTDAEAAMMACERLRRVIAETPLVIEGGEELTVTLSAGVAQMQRGDDQQKLIARADEALYRAKSAGRDRVLLAA